MKNISLVNTLLASMLLTACATDKVDRDVSASHPTAVLKANTVISGYIIPNNTGTQQVYTRPTERRINTVLNYESWLAKKIFNSDTSLIAVTDKNVAWTLNNKAKTYVECPLSGCVLKQLPHDQEQNEEESYTPNTPQSCELTTKINYDVVDKKVSRVINGFTAKEFQLIWTVENKDKLGRIDSHNIVMDFWMASPNSAMQEMWDINSQYQKNYVAAINANDSPLSRMLGQKVYMAMAAIAGDVEKNPELQGLNTKIAKLEGYPISIKFEWYAQTNACKDEQKKTADKNGSAFDAKDAVGSLTNLAGGFLKDKAKSMVKNSVARDPAKPLLRYIYDVESVAIENQPDSLFKVPANYKLENRL